MGGTIAVESEVGVGSRFWVDLPLKVLPPVRGSAHLGPVDAKRFDGLRAMVVEDNPVNVLVATRLLERMKCDVQAVVDGRQAVAAVLSADPDLVLMDVQMPGKDGLQVTRELRECGYTKPIIALTATALAEDRAACCEAGMDDFLAKPIRAEDLATVLSRWHVVTAETSPAGPASA